MTKLITLISGLMVMTNLASADFMNADVAFVIDQSGSMSGEFNWLGNSISSIDAAFNSSGITAKYGVAGYEYYAGSADTKNAWLDMTADINSVVSEVNSVKVYGGTERGYHAADWAADNFSWTSGSAKVMILVTDENADYASSYQYGSLSGELALKQKMADENILLNVITSTYLYDVWNDAVYTKGTYSGLFDLEYLRTAPTDFTKEFTSAKVSEIKDAIQDVASVPEPGSLTLLGIGLISLIGFARKRS